MKNFIYQKYHWLKIFFLFSGSVISNFFWAGIFYINSDDRYEEYYLEGVESFCWLKIHFTYKGRKIN